MKRMVHNMRISMMAMIPLSLLLFAGCTPADQQYCDSFGVGGTPEYGNCLAYYHAQDTAFTNDRMLCEFEADATYPSSLYDRGSWQPVLVGGYWAGRYRPSTEYVRVEPDWRHNQQVDELRMRIIGPCMLNRGWNSASTWQAGRQAVPPRRPKPSVSSSQVLPWLKSTGR